MIDAVPSDTVLAGGGTVIAATHRLARQIRRRHDQAQTTSGAQAWPSPDVLPLDAWLRRTWETAVLGDSPLGRLRLLSDDESRLVWRRVLAREGSERLDADLLIPLVAAGWRLCQSWGIGAAAVHAAADSEDARSFARWLDVYLRELGRHGWIDGSGLLQKLGQAGQVANPGGQALLGFAGFDPWTPALANLATRLQDDGLTVVTIVPPQPAGSCQVVAAQDEGDEFARACRWAADHSGPGANATVAIVLSNLEQNADRARRIGLDILAPGWQLREPRIRPVALAAGRQLADYPLIVCAFNLLRLLAGDLTFDQASFLLRSPYVAGADPERAGRARAELRLRRLPLERILPCTLLGVLGEAAGQAAEQWRRAESLAAPVGHRRLLPSQWAEHFSTWLSTAGWPGDRGLGSEEYQAAEAWQRLLESYAGTDEVAGTLALPAALGILMQQARDRAFEPEGSAGAVQVLSVREAEGQHFAALWICGMTADQWPPPPRPHPLVPLALQRAAGIPEASPAALEERTRRCFEQLLASADHVTLSWPAERDETETLPSPLLADFPAAVAQPGDTRSEETSLHPDRDLIAASTGTEIVSADPAPVWPSGQPVSGGARVLAMQSVCPARAFVEFRLRGMALETPARPLDRATRGRVVHRLVERLYGNPECGQGLAMIDPARLRELFAPLVTGVLDEFLPAGEPYLASLRPIETERLWALLLSIRQLDRERPGFRVVTEVARAVTIGPLQLSIRLDRLDQLDEGGELVIDYKTGRFAPAGWKASRLPDSQLPLYAVTGRSRGIAVIVCRPPAAQLLGVGDQALGVSGIKSAAAFFRADKLEWNDVLQLWQLQMENLAAEFAAGDFRVDPADRRWAVDQFAGITRIHELPAADDEADATGEADE